MRDEWEKLNKRIEDFKKRRKDSFFKIEMFQDSNALFEINDEPLEYWLRQLNIENKFMVCYPTMTNNSPCVFMDIIKFNESDGTISVPMINVTDHFFYMLDEDDFDKVKKIGQCIPSNNGKYKFCKKENITLDKE